MKSFASPIPKKEQLSQLKIDKFIDAFNKKIQKDKGISFTLNTSLDHIDQLSVEEFNAVRHQAEVDGWNIEGFDDNYQSYSYKITAK